MIRLLFFIVFITIISIARSKSDLKVSSTSTERFDSSIEHVSFAKQWTLTAASTSAITTNTNNDDESEDETEFDSIDNEHDKIDTINLQLPGRVFLSSSNNLPPNVLGYVNVSGDSQAIVETVHVTSNDNDDELDVTCDSSASTTTGYLLIEIYLATSNIVSDLEIESSTEVVIENGALATSNPNKELQIEMKQSSVMYMSSSAMSVRDLKVKLEDDAKLQLITDSITIREGGTFQAHDKSSISLFTPSIKVNDLTLDSKNTGTICIAAEKVETNTYDGEEASKISLPNASSKYTSTGTFSCDKVNIPLREPRCVSNACSTRTASSTMLADSITSPTEIAPSSDIKTTTQTGTAATLSHFYTVPITLLMTIYLRLTF